MSGIEPAHNFTCYANEEKYKVSRPPMWCNIAFITAAEKVMIVSKHVCHKTCITASEGTQHNSSITEHVMLDIPNMFGS